MALAWEFIKRHRGKIAAGVTFVGGIYAVKRVVDSDVLSELTGRQSSLVVEKEETLSKVNASRSARF